MKKLPLLLAAFCGVAALAADPPRMPAGTASNRFTVTPAPSPAATGAPGSFAPLLDHVTPAVVAIFPAKLIHDAADATDPMNRFFGNPSPSPGKGPEDNRRVMGVGSGVILTSDGWIVTNSHVVHLETGEVADALTVELHDKRRFTAQLAGSDSLTDLALLKINATILEPLPIADSDAVRIGDLVFAVGDPLDVGITATRGIVSALRRNRLDMNGAGGYESFIQTDAPINHGNSGGCLVDSTGRLIGINSAIASTTGASVGLGFAIPSNLMRRVLIGLAEDGKIVRGFFGITTSDIEVKPDTDNGLLAGAKVDEVMSGGPSEKAGIKPGDVIVTAGGQPVENRGAFRLAMSFIKPGGSLDVEYMRDGKKHAASVTAIADPGAAGGIFTIAELPGVKFRQGKVAPAVESVSDDAASHTELQPGMEIVEVNGSKTPVASALESALHKGVNEVKVRANGQEETIIVKVE